MGRELADALPRGGKGPLRALDDRAMELAAQDAELRAALFRFVDVVPACRSLDDLATPLCPFVEQPDAGRLVFWCRPDLVATVRYAGWAPDRRLRFPVFEALRPDVPAESWFARSE